MDFGTLDREIHPSRAWWLAIFPGGKTHTQGHPSLVYTCLRCGITLYSDAGISNTF